MAEIDKAQAVPTTTKEEAARAELRETAMEAAMKAAAGAVQAAGFETTKAGIVSPEAMRAEARMIQAIMDRLDIEAIQAYRDQTRLVVPFDMDVIQSVVKVNPLAHIVVAAKNEAEGDEADRALAAIDGRIRIVVTTDIETLAREEAAEIGLTEIEGKSRSVIQVRKLKAGRLTPEEQRAYALVGQMGGIVGIVGFGQRVDVSFATNFYVSDILQAQIAAIAQERGQLLWVSKVAVPVCSFKSCYAIISP